MQCAGPPVCGDALALTYQPPAARWGNPMLAKDRRRKTLNSNHLVPSGLALPGKGTVMPASRPVLHSLEPVPGPDKWEGLRQEGHPA